MLEDAKKNGSEDIPSSEPYTDVPHADFFAVVWIILPSLRLSLSSIPLDHRNN